MSLTISPISFCPSAESIGDKIRREYREEYARFCELVMDSESFEEFLIKFELANPTAGNWDCHFILWLISTKLFSAELAMELPYDRAKKLTHETYMDLQLRMLEVIYQMMSSSDILDDTLKDRKAVKHMANALYELTTYNHQNSGWSYKYKNAAVHKIIDASLSKMKNLEQGVPGSSGSDSRRISG